MTDMKTNTKSFSNDVYPLSVIEDAIKKYTNIAEINVATVADENICTFTEKEIPIQLVISEFGNYLIEILNNHGIL